MEARAMFLAERDQIVETLRGLDDEQWNRPSLCEGWSNKEVVAHMASGLKTSVPSVIFKTVKAGFNINKASYRLAKEYAATRSTAQLVDELVATTELTGFTKGIGFARLMPDITVHHEDIRRACDLPPHTVDTERMTAALSTLLKEKGPLKVTRRTKGIRFIATDLDWAGGEGAEVRGPAMSLLLAMGGRTVGLADLTGDGVALLRGR